MATWAMKRLGAAPCQWFSAGSKRTRSPGRKTSTGAAFALAETNAFGDEDGLVVRGCAKRCGRRGGRGRGGGGEGRGAGPGGAGVAEVVVGEQAGGALLGVILVAIVFMGLGFL